MTQRRRLDEATGTTEQIEREQGSDGPRLIPPAFIRRVSEYVQKQIDGQDFHSQTRQVLAQFWFGNDRRVHYEVWFHYGKSSVELGLHFEASPETNRLLFRAFDRHLVEIQMQLGTSIWLEEWDRGWARIYECVPCEPLDDYRAVEVADRMIDIIGVLQPVYEHIKAEIPSL